MIDRKTLEERANSLGLKFPKNIGDEKLNERIEAREAEIAQTKRTQSKNTQAQEGTTGASAENGQASQGEVVDTPPDNSSGSGPTPNATATKAATKTATKTQATAPEMVVVIGSKKGRRRIGRQFGEEPVKIPRGELSDDDMAALRDDATLSVSVV